MSRIQKRTIQFICPFDNADCNSIMCDINMHDGKPICEFVKLMHRQQIGTAITLDKLCNHEDIVE